jgi:hypothetical protein
MVHTIYQEAISIIKAFKVGKNQPKIYTFKASSYIVLSLKPKGMLSTPLSTSTQLTEASDGLGGGKILCERGPTYNIHHLTVSIKIIILTTLCTNINPFFMLTQIKISLKVL